MNFFLSGTEVAFALLTHWPWVWITALLRIFLISTPQFVDSKGQKSNPCNAHAKDFANAVQRRPELCTTKSFFIRLYQLQPSLGYWYWLDYLIRFCALLFQLDYATFSCPAGYVFEGSNNITHYAFCKNWNFIYLFDLSKTCVREFSCPFWNLKCLIQIFNTSVKI